METPTKQRDYDSIPDHISGPNGCEAGCPACVAEGDPDAIADADWKQNAIDQPGIHDIDDKTGR
ncbi:hypothetical protein LCGC14_1124630 [marine sediment metagenome]|uniref:Uncharacterized protein n=1 Tax=marine sediment metagenome TaxID=412755 RepID=A0A0F9N2Z3_9ZZZZ